MRPDPQGRRERGAEAEEAASALLQKSGLRLLERNARYAFGELDLVMRDGGELVFVEVRFRRHAGFGGGLASVDAGKRRRLALAAQAWLSAHPEHADTPCRFDVVAIAPGAGGPDCEWIRAAFTLDDLG
jgi:putative endonuclease